MFKLAVDNQIGKNVIRKLERHYEVVLTAGDKADEDWIPEALDLGANVFVSPDLDVPNFLDRENDPAIWIDVPQNLSGDAQFTFIMKKLKSLQTKVV